MALTGQEYMDRLAVDDPEFYAYLLAHPDQMANVQKQADNYASQATGAGRQQYSAFTDKVHTMPVYKQYETAPDAPPDGTPEEPVPGEEVPPEEDTGPSEAELDAQADVRAEMDMYLTQWGLQALSPWVEEMITNGASSAEIMVSLRQQPEYLAAFPENAMRQENGLSWMSEAEILEYRDGARRISAEYMGIEDITNDEIAGLISEGVSLTEWEERMATWKSFQQWGPAVQDALELELGFQIDDERTWMFMNPSIPTPELDAAYQAALYRGQPAVLGFGIRPEEEADILRQFGLSPEKAFEGYQGVASDLPRQERLSMIENYMNSLSNQPGTADVLGDTSFGELFRAIQLQDPVALLSIQQRMAREAARFHAGGGPLKSGTASIGLLNPTERQ